VGASTPVLDLLRLLVTHQRRFYFVLEGAEITGLATWGDLDKRPVRTAVFALMNAVEDALLQCITVAHGDGDEWVRLLHDEKVYKRILGHWERAKNRDLELSPIHYASLTTLIRIASRSPELSARFTERLGSDWSEQMAHLRDFARDPVSHPGKPLIDQPGKILTLWKACAFGERTLDSLATL
jgi:hypothetical protein